MGRHKEDIKERFWKFVNKKNDDECWEWKGSVTKSRGYGQIGFDNTIKGAHRVSWEIHYGEIPDEMCICHHCDNSKCVNPFHLFIGTRSDNMQDMLHKGRGRLNKTYKKVIE